MIATYKQYENKKLLEDIIIYETGKILENSHLEPSTLSRKNFKITGIEIWNQNI